MRTLFIITLLLCAALGAAPTSIQAAYLPSFDGSQAYDYLQQQCDYGPRPPGSDNLSRCRVFMADTLLSNGWTVTLQNFTYNSVKCSNVIATYGSANATIILGAHYDTRPHADHDPAATNRTLPILGANDGGSGTAVLLELSKSLPENVRPSVELVFFDAEDSGYINGWDWIVGSTYYVDNLSSERISQIRAMLLLDMVGDSDLRLLRETSSTVSLQNLVWGIAKGLGHDDVFLDARGAGILDDHRPFLDAGIPALDIIQHDPFPWYWHTLEDTPDKCSATSLETVGSVVEAFVYNMTLSSTTFSQPTGSIYSLLPWVLPPLALVAVVIWFRKRR
ncbi:MAG: M28 family peptidase [Candidatus Thorarchaeota archaeon]|nr:M28 family peptidase [Candidatus Thorarchaeota archaeon]